MRKLWRGLPLLVVLVLAAVVIIPSQSPSSPPAALVTPSSPVKISGTVASPEDVGLSSERLERFANTVERSINDGHIAGAVTLVARHGKIAYFKAFGMADREAKKPMRTDSIFRICSMSKPITSVAVMMLYEEGRFMLDEPVSDFIPEFKDMKVLDPPVPQDKTSPPGALVNAKRPITIFQLLTHTLGCFSRKGPLGIR
jgi:CubicO group peptidase (beta-lactamase class C family)